VFFLFGIPISSHDARYLLTALGTLGSNEAMDAAVMIALGMTGRRRTVPLSPAMQEAVCAALDEAPEPPDALRKLRNRVRRKVLLVPEW
jgi:uncharacterized protein (DUF1778 family)